MDLKIEKGVPIPPAAAGTAHKAVTYSELGDMEPGDSIFVPGVYLPRTGERGMKEYRRLMAAVARERKKRGWTIITRKLIQDGKTGTRVWRVE